MKRIALTLKFAALTLPLAACIAGCAGGFKVDDGHLRYPSELPDGISYAWRQADKVWMVPSRNVFIGPSISGDNGVFYTVRPEGSYFTVENAPLNMLVVIDGVPKPLNFPRK